MPGDMPDGHSGPRQGAVCGAGGFSQPIRLISWVGTRLPANATAVGKALLSGLTNEEVRALYAGACPG
ncbi:MAG: IclR family transcriptional regulator C-terminal domain-containing protein [Dysosmobacter welbionis]